MRLTTYHDAASFLDIVRPELAEREVEHHLLLGVAEAVAAARAPNDSCFAATVSDDGGLLVAAFMLHQRPLLIASDRSAAPAAFPLLRDALASTSHEPRHVIGPSGMIERGMQAWRRETERPARIAMHQRLYALESVAPIPATGGHLRLAVDDDFDLVMRWTSAFEREALAHVAPQSTAASVATRIAAGEIRLWCDPEPRTMAASARPTRRTIAVNGVYTPAEWRRFGYATACVAALSAALLARGFERCVLYTDLSNPTSNAIYTRIGYHPVRDFLMYDLGDRPSHDSSPAEPEGRGLAS